MMAQGMEAKHQDITPETRLSFFKAFGVTPDEQVAMEDYYQTWSCDFHMKVGEDELSCIGGAPM